jgi:hypothetical protein
LKKDEDPNQRIKKDFQEQRVKNRGWKLKTKENEANNRFLVSFLFLPREDVKKLIREGDGEENHNDRLVFWNETKRRRTNCKSQSIISQNHKRTTRKQLNNRQRLTIDLKSASQEVES